MKILELRQCIDPAGLIVTVKGVRVTQVDKILDFGSFYRIVCTGKKAVSYPREDVEIQRNCLAGDKQKSVFNCFKETAEAVGLVVGDNLNILSKQYERIQAVSEKTVLACYLGSGRRAETFSLPETVIYPFGLNQSQKVAVEHALSSQISIIQGPPGTGKTQTILNIIANAVRNGKTVAVVSNNNSATLNVAEKLEKKGLSFLTAFLGSINNKERFLEAQAGRCPDMGEWTLGQEEKTQLKQEVTTLSADRHDG